MLAPFEKGSPLRRFVKRVVAVSARPLLGTITHVATDEPLVALTFDDGPHPEWTPRLLDLLDRHGARATFFVVGRAAARHPELLERMTTTGHALGNHSWDHPSLPLLTSRARRLQIEWCRQLLPPGTLPLLRPPWGHQDLASRLDAARLGHRVVTWNVMAEDWGDDPADLLLDRVASQLAPGSIVLFHDRLFVTDHPRHFDRAATVEAVATLLERFSGRYRFVTVPELLEAGRPRFWHWYKPPDQGWLRGQLYGPEAAKPAS